jgi:hypothetical protein
MMVVLAAGREEVLLRALAASSQYLSLVANRALVRVVA